MKSEEARDGESSVAFDWPDQTPPHSHQYIAPVLAAWLASRRPARILDLGCGNGTLTALVQSWGHDVTGLDASPSGVDVAKRHAPSIRFVQHWLERPLPLDLQGQFDAVMSAEVIEHLPTPRVLLERAREALTSSGSVILTTPYHGYLKNLALALVNGFDRHWHPLRDGGHIKFFSRATLFGLLESEGFSPTRFTRVGRVPVMAKSMIVEARVRQS
jgi:2-polyprenyl-3-methyl-5-hydroxy-6-metoxy-1,4-benzoquinol methylase